MRRPLLVLCVFALAAEARAQQGAVSSEVDARKIGVEDAVQWTVTLEGPAAQVGEVPLPPLKNLKVVGGPSVSTQISLVNGRMSQSKSLTWVLQPLGQGPAEVGAVKVAFAGGEAHAPAVSLEVGPGSLRPKGGQRRGSPFGADPFEDFFGERPAARSEGKLFLEASPSRKRVKVGESVLLTYYLYGRGVRATDMQPAGTPQYPGFWAENVESPDPPRQEAVNVEGEAFTRVAIFRKLLFATKAGELTIPPLTLRVALARQSLFDTGMVVERATKPVTIQVEALPAGAEATGAVGRFKVTASAEPTTLRLGDAATVRFKVEGTGNLKWVERGPELVVPGAKVFPPQVKSSLQARVDGYAGSKTWEYVVVPETSGALAVPALPFTYFDPGEGKVVNVSSPALELAVEGGVAGGLEAARPAPAPRGRSGLALRDSLEGGAVGRRALGPRALLAVLLLAALVHAGLAWSARSGWRAGTHPRGNARAALGHLRRAAEPGLAKEEAAALIEKALKEAFADQNGDDGERSRVVDRLLDEVQQVRYAPQLGDYSERLKDLAQQAREAVQRWA